MAHIITKHIFSIAPFFDVPLLIATSTKAPAFALFKWRQNSLFLLYMTGNNYNRKLATPRVDASTRIQTHWDARYTEEHWCALPPIDIQAHLRQMAYEIQFSPAFENQNKVTTAWLFEVAARFERPSWALCNQMALSVLLMAEVNWSDEAQCLCPARVLLASGGWLTNDLDLCGSWSAGCRLLSQGLDSSSERTGFVSLLHTTLLHFHLIVSKCINSHVLVNRASTTSNLSHQILCPSQVILCVCLFVWMCLKSKKSQFFIVICK